MSSEKIKSENYNGLGGINTKVNPPLNSPLEFLSIKNYDFQTPGALTCRWGSTTMFATGTSGQLPQRTLSLYNFSNYNGTSMIIASGAAHTGNSGFIYYGSNQLLALSGMSLTNLNETLVFNWPAWQIYVGGDQALNVKTQSGIKIVGGTINGASFAATFTINPTAGNTGNAMSWVSYDNWAFGADGNKFIKFNGSSAYSFGVPPGIGGITQSVWSTSSSTVGFGLSGAWALYASYVNCRGVEGEAWPIGVINIAANGASLGGSLIATKIVVKTPLQYGITSVNIYSYFNGGTFLGDVQPGGNGAVFGSSLWTLPYRFLSNTAVSGSTLLVLSAPGSTIGGQTFLQTNSGKLPEQQYGWIGGVTYLIGGSPEVYGAVNFAGSLPSILEIHKDRLFMAGFSSSPRTFKWSDVGEPEGFQPENEADLSSQDSDPITAMKSYKGNLYIFTKNSVSAFYGDNTSNFVLSELTREYGAINKFSVVSFNNALAFLDKKNLVAFNGSSFERLSDKVQPIFDYIESNSNARVVNDSIRKQIICAFPATGASVNNKIMAFDYSVNAWTEYTSGLRYDALCMANGVGNYPSSALMVASNNIIVGHGPSLRADGIDGGSLGFTLSFKTRFLHDIGDSYTKQYRRLYVNLEGTGSTQTLTANFYQDYGTSIVLSTTMHIFQNQNRIDFGIPAKSLSFELSRLSSIYPLKINGFTVESRLQRKV